MTFIRNCFAVLVAGLAVATFGATGAPAAGPFTTTFRNVQVTTTATSFDAAAVAAGVCAARGHPGLESYRLGRYVATTPPPGGTAIYTSVTCRVPLKAVQGGLLPSG